MNEAPALRLAELHRFLERYPQTRFLDVLFADICGELRGKRLSASEFEKAFTGGVQLPISTYFLDVLGNCHDPCGRGISDGDPDGTGVPLAKTLSPVPWSTEPRAEVLMTMLDEQGQPVNVEPRNLAAALLSRFDALGYRPVVAFELEFYLIDPAAGEGRAPVVAALPGTGEPESTTQVYGLTQLDARWQLFSDIDKFAQAQGLDTSVASAEFSPGQYEVNLKHGDALKAADDCLRLRHVVRSTAKQHGLRATFMPKPFLDYLGSGMHVHISLLDGDGSNVFDDGTAAGSAQLRHGIGGLLNLMRESTAFFAPDINNFRRLKPGPYTPNKHNWAYNNRAVSLRVPIGPASARRIEHRVAGANANPYLVLAAVLAGVLDGIEHRRDPGDPGVESGLTKRLADLPHQLPAALTALRGAKHLREYIDADYLALYTAAKEGELADLEASISEAEYLRYL